MTKTEKRAIVKTARELSYPPEVIRKLEVATTSDECNKIMRAARHNLQS